MIENDSQNASQNLPKYQKNDTRKTIKKVAKNMKTETCHSKETGSAFNFQPRHQRRELSQTV